MSKDHVIRNSREVPVVAIRYPERRMATPPAGSDGFIDATSNAGDWANTAAAAASSKADRMTRISSAPVYAHRQARPSSSRHILWQPEQNVLRFRTYD